MSQQQIETAADVATEMLAANSPAEVQAQVRRAYLLGRFEAAASNMDQLIRYCRTPLEHQLETSIEIVRGK